MIISLLQIEATTPQGSGGVIYITDPTAIDTQEIPVTPAETNEDQSQP